MTNNNPPPMPERIWVEPPPYDDDMRRYVLRIPLSGFQEYIRADLSRPRLTDEEVEKLKAKTDGLENEAVAHYYDGWNDCIDHLRQRGII
jgi:hypothetical protein